MIVRVTVPVLWTLQPAAFEKALLNPIHNVFLLSDIRIADHERFKTIRCSVPNLKAEGVKTKPEVIYNSASVLRH